MPRPSSPSTPIKAWMHPPTFKPLERLSGRAAEAEPGQPICAHVAGRGRPREAAVKASRPRWTRCRRPSFCGTDDVTGVVDNPCPHKFLESRLQALTAPQQADQGEQAPGRLGKHERLAIVYSQQALRVWWWWCGVRVWGGRVWHAQVEASTTSNHAAKHVRSLALPPPPVHMHTHLGSRRRQVLPLQPSRRRQVSDEVVLMPNHGCACSEQQDQDATRQGLEGTRGLSRRGGGQHAAGAGHGHAALRTQFKRQPAILQLPRPSSQTFTLVAAHMKEKEN